MELEKKKIKLIIAYDGTNYHGYQSQKNARTVQDTLEEAMRRLFELDTATEGCSRTDAGVHAEAFTLHAMIPYSFPTERLVPALNTYLPDDIAALHACDAPSDFHARFSCIGKTYRYNIYNSQVRNPFLTFRAWKYPYKLDVARMADAASMLIGCHDFASYMAQGSPVSSTVRTIFSYKVEQKGDIIALTVSADGFLYNMVRIMTGTLVREGAGRAELSVSDITKSRDRTQAGMTAPAHGLYLIGQEYNNLDKDGNKQISQVREALPTL